MEKFFDIIDKIAGAISWIVLRIAILLTAIMTIIVIVGVFFRYLLQNPLGWTETLARYLMIWGALLAVSIGIRDKEHVGLTFVVNRLPIKAARVVNFITGIVILVFLYELTTRGWRMALNGMEQQSLALGISMFWPLASVPVTGALAIIQQVFNMILTFDPRKSHKDIFGETEVDEALKEAKKVKKVSLDEIN